MYGSAALLHRGIYASVRIRAPAAAAAASPEVVTVLPGRCDRCPGGGGGGGEDASAGRCRRRVGAAAASTKAPPARSTPARRSTVTRPTRRGHGR